MVPSWTIMQQIEHHLCCEASKFYLRLADRRKWRRHVASHPDIVKTDDAQLLGHCNASFLTSHQYANGDHIVLTKNSGNSCFEQTGQRGLPGSDIFLRRGLSASCDHYPRIATWHICGCQCALISMKSLTI